MGFCAASRCAPSSSCLIIPEVVVGVVPSSIGDDLQPVERVRLVRERTVMWICTWEQAGKTKISTAVHNSRDFAVRRRNFREARISQAELRNLRQRQ